MPRIDPLQLLKCLSVLLSPEGGILSREEVPRLVNLMTKFSKKLVSKCVYLLILKSTDIKLVDMFMTSGGWLLVHTWLQEAMLMANWNLVSEILELLLVTPVDSGRLRLNNIPKLVKTLSKREDLSGVRDMAVSLVNNWLAIVKSTNAVQEAEKIIEREKNDPLLHNESDIVSDDTRKTTSPTVVNEIETVVLQEAPPSEENEGVTKMDIDENDGSIGTGMFYKITVRDGKQVISRMASDDDMEEKQMIEELAPEVEVRDEVNDVKNVDKKDDTKQKSSSKLKSSSSSSRSSSSKSSSRSRDRDKHRSSSSKNSSSKSSSSSSSNRDRDRKRDKERDRDHKNNGASKQSSNSSRSSSSSSSSKDKKDAAAKDPKETKEKQAEKDKDTLAKLKPQSIDKMGRIPKKAGVVAPPSPAAEEIKKKPSISIEVRKKTDDRPKTVKIFNSKMRSTGLEEEVKPPPPRIAKKPPPPIPANLPIPPKRPSPTRDLVSQPLEKKPKIDIPDRPGAVKLIPPKPKPAFLQESDIFMDALTASASSKKEPKKRKRRASVSKDSPENSPSVTQSPTVTSPPIGIKTFTPANFYQDTLDTSDAKENKENESISDDIPLSQIKAEIENSAPPVTIPTESVEDNLSESERRPLNSEGLRSVLAYGKRKGPKRSVRWKTEDELVEIKFFELDETERVNVSRTNFNDMAKMEMSNEREALLSRKLPNEDLMEPVTLWGMPYEVDQAELPVQPGSKSLEKDIQYAREKNILQALYFSKKHIPDSATEPIPENHQMVDPVIIPLEDPESQEYDLRNTVWPEPKGNSPVEPPAININPSLFQNMPAPYPNFPPMQPHGFPGMPPAFCPPNIMNNGPPNMMPNGGNMNMMGPPNMVGPGPGDMMNQGPMDPNNMYGPGPDNFNPMMNDAPNFPMPPFNQPNMNMFGPPNNFNMNRGGNRNSGYRRGSGNNNWNRNGPGNWNNNRRGGRLCKNIKNHGFCRNIDNCPFVHPN